MTTTKDRKTMRVMLIEDNPADQNLMQRALKKSIYPIDLHIEDNGVSALEYLGNDSRRNVLKPHIILLDINMPRMNGKEFLKIVKADEVLKKIPVLMMSTSSSATDICEAYSLGVNAYIVKPMEAEKYFETIQTIEKFWFDFVVLPTTD